MNLTIQCAWDERVRTIPQKTQNSPVKLQIDVAVRDGVTILHCRGRITYRHEATRLSETVTRLLPTTRQLVLDLSGVEKIDSAGLGELVLMSMRAKASHCSLRLAAPRPEIWELLRLTNLTSILDVHPSVPDAILSLVGRIA